MNYSESIVPLLNKKIYVIEQDPDIRDLIMRLIGALYEQIHDDELEKLSKQFVFVDTISDAKEHLQKEDYANIHLIILSLGPQEAGKSLIGYLRTPESPYNKTPLLVITDDQEEFQDNVGYIKRPFGADNFQSTVGTLLAPSTKK